MSVPQATVMLWPDMICSRMLPPAGTALYQPDCCFVNSLFLWLYNYSLLYIVNKGMQQAFLPLSAMFKENLLLTHHFADPGPVIDVKFFVLLQGSFQRPLQIQCSP